jgi:hypothetical protein
LASLGVTPGKSLPKPDISSATDNTPSFSIAENRNLCYEFLFAVTYIAGGRRNPIRDGAKNEIGLIARAPRDGTEFFTPNARNPLKSPDSKK